MTPICVLVAVLAQLAVCTFFLVRLHNQQGLLEDERDAIKQKYLSLIQDIEGEELSHTGNFRAEFNAENGQRFQVEFLAYVYAEDLVERDRRKEHNDYARLNGVKISTDKPSGRFLHGKAFLLKEGDKRQVFDLFMHNDEFDEYGFRHPRNF